jgi:hypothetical protein
MKILNSEVIDGELSVHLVGPEADGLGAMVPFLIFDSGLPSSSIS